MRRDNAPGPEKAAATAGAGAAGAGVGAGAGAGAGAVGRSGRVSSREALWVAGRTASPFRFFSSLAWMDSGEGIAPRVPPFPDKMPSRGGAGRGGAGFTVGEEGVFSLLNSSEERYFLPSGRAGAPLARPSSSSFRYRLADTVLLASPQRGFRQSSKSKFKKTRSPAVSGGRRGVPPQASSPGGNGPCKRGAGENEPHSGREGIRPGGRQFHPPGAPRRQKAWSAPPGVPQGARSCGCASAAPQCRPAHWPSPSWPPRPCSPPGVPVGRIG